CCAPSMPPCPPASTATHRYDRAPGTRDPRPPDRRRAGRAHGCAAHPTRAGGVAWPVAGRRHIPRPDVPRPERLERSVTRYLPPGTRAAPPAALRLFCFPFAGGGASAYARWGQRLGPDVAVLPVQLPGREGRMSEPRITDLDALVDDLDAQLGPEL